MALRSTGVHLDNAALVQNNSFKFTIDESFNRNVGIETSSNLKDWIPLTNFVGSNTPIQFLDATATNAPNRFYRAVVP